MTQEKLREMVRVSISEIHLDAEFNCRGHLAPIDVMDLADDLKEQGQISPVLLMIYPEDKQLETGFKYLLTVGYRRTTAAKIINWEYIDAIIQPTMPEEEARYLNLRENVQRKDLNVLQEAKAMFKLKQLGVSREAAAKHLGKSSAWVQIRYMLLELPKEIQAEAGAGIITQSQIRGIHTILRKNGELACFTAAKKIKTARAAGKKSIIVNPNLIDGDRKANRKRPEIFPMMEIVRTNLGNGFYTRCMAWCAGEISSNELKKSIKAECEKLGNTFQDAIED